MDIGVFRTSLKEHERRVPIYHEHLPFIPEQVRTELTFEQGYGSDYGFPDSFFLCQGAGVADRDRLFRKG